MKIAILCAAGRSGRLITREALSRGHAVTAVVRPGESLPPEVGEVTTVVCDILETTREFLTGFDVVIDCFGVWREQDAHLHTDTLMHLCDCLSGTKTRLLVIGGAGSLYTDASHTHRFHEDPSFPDDTRVVSAAQAASFDKLRTRTDVRWTYLCPNGIYDYDRPRTGHYCLAGEEIVPNTAGPIPIHFISYADFAIAMVDEAERASAVGARISVHG
jgi:hypothetical protein